MDVNPRKYCPNCSQAYTLIQQSSTAKSNYPLFLQCGHSMCEKCIRNIIRHSEPVECKICQQDTTVEASKVALLHNDRKKLYELFPVNYPMLGELTFNLEFAANQPSQKDKEYFIDLQGILDEGGSKNAECLECHRPTKKMCQQCNNNICDTCYTKTHRNYLVFKNHVLKDIDELLSPPVCKIHKDKLLDYYCTDCNKCNCMDCLVIGGDNSCKNHNIKSMQEVNENFLEELGQIAPKANETFRRLSKTAYDVGHMLYNMESETGSRSELDKIQANIEQHFSKLYANIQKHKQEVIGIVTNLKVADKESLYKAKNDLTESIIKGKKVMGMIAMTSDQKKIKQLNLAALLEDAKQIAESAWYLSREENKKDSLKVVVNEDLCGLISDYVHLEGNASSVYKLSSTADLGEGVEIPPPPPALVFAPVLPKDVRETKNKQAKPKEQQPKAEQKESTPTFFLNPPTYKSKSGSVNSLNSCSSGSSQRSYLPNKNHSDVSHKKPNVQPVQPFAETHQMKQLLEGTQELVYISHIVTPHDFYVQRACHQILVKEMIRQFRKGDTYTKPSANHVAVDKMYLAYNKADKMWQRCRIVRVDKTNPEKTLFNVFFFDFGSSDIVDAEKLRLIPPHASPPPPLAINCALANSAPLSGQWRKEDAFLVHNIVDNKQVVIHVRLVHPAGNGNVKLECDVITYEDGISIAHALLFHERAKMPEPWLKYPQHHGLKEKAKIFVSHDTYNHKTVEEVCISHVDHPDKFFVRKKHQQKYYEDLTLDLEQDYSMNVRTGTIYLPEIGMSCCVHIPEAARGEGGAMSAGGAWSRAIVTGLPGRGRVALALVDSGATHVAHWSTLRYLHTKYTKLSALATECHLAGVAPYKGKWSAGSVALMHKFSDRYLDMHVEERRSKGAIAVTLVDNTDPENPVCVNEEMVKHKFAITFGIYSFNKSEDLPEQGTPYYSFNKSEDLSEQGTSYRPPLKAPPRQNKPKSETTILKRNTAEPQKIKTGDLEAKDKGPLRVEAEVLQYQSPSLIYVAITQQKKTFYEMFNEMQEYYSNNKPSTKDKWEVGDRCCAICIQSKTWRRAVIVEIDGENAKVFYSDFASVETLPLTSLAELTPHFASLGDAAIKCHLFGVVPAVGEEWPSLTKEYLGDLLECYKRIFITRVGSFKNKSMPVEIWVYHTIQGGALEPNRSEWRCLNKKIVEQGLGVPDTSEECRAANSEVKPETGDNMLSFFKLTGNINDWLQLEPIPTKHLPRLGSPSQSDTLTNSDDQIEDMDASNVMLISDWLPPEPLAAKEFTAMPTYIDNDGVIYLHDVSQLDTLDVIRKALELHFEKPDPKAKYYKWEVGEPCIAKFYLDDRFYRGRVLEVNEEASSCLIHYIDYGNEEPCSFINMRKSVALHEVPTQSHKCILHRIQPINKTWERRSLDYIHKSVVEKYCHVKVMGDTVNGVTPVTLNIDKICINDHLVEFDMATYTDGSKAVVRKFVPAKREVKPKPASIPDSDPDYIIEDDSSKSDVSSVKPRDWNEMLREDNTSDDSFIIYPEELQDEFVCNITVIENKENLELNIVHDDETTAIYEELTKDLQTDGESRPAIDGVFANKACIALFHQDMQWYRAAILEYSEAMGKVKVRYVDYGNTEVIDLTDVREIDPEWAKLPPRSVTVRLHGVKLNQEVDVNTVAQAYKETFLDESTQPFNGKVIKTDKYPIVELRDKKGELVYQNLFDSGIFQVSEE